MYGKDCHASQLCSLEREKADKTSLAAHAEGEGHQPMMKLETESNGTLPEWTTFLADRQSKIERQLSCSKCEVTDQGGGASESNFTICSSDDGFPITRLAIRPTKSVPMACRLMSMQKVLCVSYD